MASAMFNAPWFRGGPARKVMPREIWASLSPRAQEITREMVPAEGDPPLETGLIPNGSYIAGEGPKHRLSPERVHQIRQEFGGSQTGMMYTVLASEPKL